MNETPGYNKTRIYHSSSSCLNSTVSFVHTFNHRRCFSSDNLCMSASVDRSSSPLLSASTDAVYTGSLVGTSPTAVQWVSSGRDSPAVIEAAVLPGSQGDADCLPLGEVTWSYDAARTDASHLLLTTADQSDNGQQSLTDGSSCLLYTSPSPRDS